MGCIFLLCLVGNFCLHARHCEFYVLGPEFFKYPLNISGFGFDIIKVLGISLIFLGLLLRFPSGSGTAFREGVLWVHCRCAAFLRTLPNVKEHLCPGWSEHKLFSALYEPCGLF